MIIFRNVVMTYQQKRAHSLILLLILMFASFNSYSTDYMVWFDTIPNEGDIPDYNHYGLGTEGTAFNNAGCIARTDQPVQFKSFTQFNTVNTAIRVATCDPSSPSTTMYAIENNAFLSCDGVNMDYSIFNYPSGSCKVDPPPDCSDTTTEHPITFQLPSNNLLSYNVNGCSCDTTDFPIDECYSFPDSANPSQVYCDTTCTLTGEEATDELTSFDTSTIPGNNNTQINADCEDPIDQATNPLCQSTVHDEYNDSNTGTETTVTDNGDGTTTTTSVTSYPDGSQSTTTTTTDSSGNETTTTTNTSGQAEGQGSSTESIGDCQAIPQCVGDAIQCSIAKQLHDINCQLTDETIEELPGTYEQDVNNAFGNTQTLQQWAEGTEIDISDPLQGYTPNIDAACPPDYVVNTTHGALTIPFSYICQLAELLRVFVLIAAYFSAAMIYYNGLIKEA